MVQVVKKISFRESDMIKAHDLAFLNLREATKRKSTILKAFSGMTPRSISKSREKRFFSNK